MKEENNIFFIPSETQHIIFVCTMITSLPSFASFAKSGGFCDKCIGFMEKGVLHVDTVNELGLTIGFYLMSPVLTTDHRLWDRYWALATHSSNIRTTSTSPFDAA